MKIWTKIYHSDHRVAFILPGLGSGGGGQRQPTLVMVADTRKFTGWEAWWTNLYNESHVYFTLLTVAIIPVVGVIFGTIADLIMSRIGIDLKSRELAEH